MTPEQKSELLEAIKRYGQAEVEFGKAISDYAGMISMQDTSLRVGIAFGEVITLLNRL